VVMLLRRDEGRPLAFWWVTLLTVAVLLTLITKVAFIGWGLGSAALNFTGISGHAVLSAAVYPLLFATLASHGSRRVQAVAIVVGCSIAVMVGISRLIVGVHSESEVFAGLLLGGLSSAVVASRVAVPRSVMRPLIPAMVALWLAWTPVHSPTSPTHGMVIQLSLKLSGNSQPFTRRDLLRSTVTSIRRVA
jgi:membrane-associated phospholipid phosphatase